MTHVILAALILQTPVQPPMRSSFDRVSPSRTAAPAVEVGPIPFGEDKLQHFFASYAATAFTYGGARTAGIDRTPALGVSVGAGLAAGVAKELIDERRGGSASARDLIADALGVAAAYILLSQIR